MTTKITTNVNVEGIRKWSDKAKSQVMWFGDIETEDMEVDGKTDIILTYWQALKGKISPDGKPTVLKRTNGEGYMSFNGWLQDIVDEKRNSIVVFHNANFDVAYSNAWYYLWKLGFKPVIMALDYGSFVFKLKRGKKQITFIDSANFFSMKLEKLGKLVGLKKLPMPKSDAHDSAWVEYNQRDVDIIFAAMCTWKKLMTTLCKRNVGLTRASDALTAFINSKKPNKIYRHDSKRLMLLENLAYCGGRVTPFKLGNLSGLEWAYLDFNSLYPDIMRNTDMPCRYVGCRIGISQNMAKELAADYILLVKGKFYTTEPVLPMKTDDSLNFNAGLREGAWCGNEAVYALENCHADGKLDVYCYSKGRPFTALIDKLFKIKADARKTGNESLATTAKLMMNSIYGKFGQKGYVFKEIGNLPGEDFASIDNISDPSKEKAKTIHYGDKKYESYQEGFSIHSSPIVAAVVTANARIKLWNMIKKAGLENTAYVDTDSIVLPNTDRKRLADNIDQLKLGYLAVEGISNYLIINGKKDYEFGDKVVHKGIPKNAKLIEDNKWQFTRIKSLRAVMFNHFPTKGNIYTVTRRRLL